MNQLPNYVRGVEIIMNIKPKFNMGRRKVIYMTGKPGSGKSYLAHYGISPDKPRYALHPDSIGGFWEMYRNEEILLVEDLPLYMGG